MVPDNGRATGAASGGDALRKKISRIVGRARDAQRLFESCTQAGVDEVVTAAGWAIVEPNRNRELAELAVADSGLGNAADKIVKNHRKTIGLLRDLARAKSVGVIAEYPERGIVEIARPVGVVAALTPSTNPGATPINNILNALKGRNAIVIAPSPKGHRTGVRLLEFVHAELDRVGAPRDLVQLLPTPVSKAASAELMRQADLVVVTGSQANVRAGYSSGTPALGVGAGNVAVIVDESADTGDAAEKIARSKVFDYATSCSSENSAIVHAKVYGAMLAEFARQGGVLLDAGEKAQLQKTMFPGGHLSPDVTAQPVSRICAIAGLERPDAIAARFLIVEENGAGPEFPFSGEKLAPVLALYRAHDFAHAFSIMRDIYAYQGNGHSCGIYTKNQDQVMKLGLEMTVTRVIVNQAHTFATGGSFDNGLPFSLSMGCGTWGRNSFSDNLNYRHFLNITRIVRTIEPDEPMVDDLFGAYRKKYGA
jgi:sulfoacetaldehyde dehydrogenase